MSIKTRLKTTTIIKRGIWTRRDHRRKSTIATIADFACVAIPNVMPAGWYKYVWNDAIGDNQHYKKRYKVLFYYIIEGSIRSSSNVRYISLRIFNKMSVQPLNNKLSAKRNCRSPIYMLPKAPKKFPISLGRVHVFQMRLSQMPHRHLWHTVRKLTVRQINGDGEETFSLMLQELDSTDNSVIVCGDNGPSRHHRSPNGETIPQKYHEYLFRRHWHPLYPSSRMPAFCLKK